MAGEFGEMPITMLPQLTYQMSFGNMPHGTVYLDRLSGFFDQAKSIDRREDIKQEIKALTTSSNLFATGTNYTSTSGSIPVLVNSSRFQSLRCYIQKNTTCKRFVTKSYKQWVVRRLCCKNSIVNCKMEGRKWSSTIS